MVQKTINITYFLLLCIPTGLLWSDSSLAFTPKQVYSQAEVCYKELRHSANKMKYRHNWLRCIDKFQRVHRLDPSGPWAAAGLYKSGKLYQELAKRSGTKSDYQEARDIFERIIGQFPGSRYRGKAAAEIQILNDDIGKMIDTEATTVSTGEHVQPQVDNSNKSDLGTVDDLRFWSNPNYTRIVIDASRETSYDHHLLKKDPSINKPQRLYVDLKESRLGKNIKKRIPINDDLLKDARAGQYTPDSVRVVVDINSFKTYKIFSLKDPFRIVIDVWGVLAEKKANQQKPSVALKKNGSLPAGALAKQLVLGISRIIIDPGHGGRDYGAPGYLKGVHEKEIVLQISRRLAKKIQQELDCEVFMTRNSDRFLTLEERTAIANTKNADLFISIHTNSHRNRRAFGIETYFLNLATDDEAIRVAAIENATSTKNISDLQNILYDLVQNAKINESSRLAGHVQGSMINHLKRKRYSRINDKGVKQAPFYVLLGAQMPAVLVETSFISNPTECKRLINPEYQERLCEAIVRGIKQYIKETTPTAHLEPPPELANNG
jgi:N-acetylmuramoyl-L-alanine amidase